MKIVVQRAKQSHVTVENEIIGKIDHGLVIFVCLETGDSNQTIDNAVYKIINLRIFEKEDDGKMNHNIQQINGQILCISQFTLSWDGRKGHRPSFDRSMEPQMARIFIKTFCDKLKQHVPVETGVFGQNMDVVITNDGPVTFFLDF